MSFQVRHKQAAQESFNISTTHGSEELQFSEHAVILSLLTALLFNTIGPSPKKKKSEYTFLQYCEILAFLPSLIFQLTNMWVADFIP